MPTTSWDYPRRSLLHYRTMREGEDITGWRIFGPHDAHQRVRRIGRGHHAWYFRKAGVGPLIGKRTWGGLRAAERSFQLVDKVVSPPSVGFLGSDKREWVAEERGHRSRYRRRVGSKAARAGTRSATGKAVEILLEMLEKNPLPWHQRPPFPNYHSGRKLNPASPAVD